MAGPELGEFVTYEELILVREQSFTLRLQMVLEEVDDVQEPTNVDLLLIDTTEHWLSLSRAVCLILRDIKMSDLAIAVCWIKGEWC